MAPPRQPRPKTRHLVRWTDDMDKKLLLTIQWVCNRKKIQIPWDLVGAEMGATITAGAVIQHLSKLRQKMVADGLPVPPPLARGGGGGGRGDAAETPTGRGKVPPAAPSGASKTRRSLPIKTKTAEEPTISDDENETDESSGSEYGKSQAKRNKGAKKSVKQEDISGDDRLFFGDSTKERMRSGSTAVAKKEPSDTTESLFSSDTSGDEKEDVRCAAGDKMWDLDADGDSFTDNDIPSTPKNNLPAIEVPAAPKKSSFKFEPVIPIVPRNDFHDSDDKTSQNPTKFSSKSDAKSARIPKKRLFKSLISKQPQKTPKIPKKHKSSSSEELAKPLSKIVKLKMAQKLKANAGEESEGFDDSNPSSSLARAAEELAGGSVTKVNKRVANRKIPEGYELYTSEEMPPLSAFRLPDNISEFVATSNSLYHAGNFDGGLGLMEPFDGMVARRDSIQSHHEIPSMQASYAGYPETSYDISHGGNLIDTSGSHGGQVGLDIQNFHDPFLNTHLSGSTLGPINEPHVPSERHHMQPCTSYIGEDNVNLGAEEWVNSGAYGSGQGGGYGGGYGEGQAGMFDRAFDGGFDGFSGEFDGGFGAGFGGGFDD